MEVDIPRREVRRSFALNVFNGVAFNLAERLIDPPLVLTWFVSQLTSSNLLIGLVAPLGSAGWFLPQIFVSVRIQRMPRKMPSYALAAVIRTVAWLLLATAVWLVDDPLLLLVAFFVLYAVARVASGLAGLAFFDVMAKTIPAQRRGSLFAWRQFLGGVLGLGAGWIVKMVLNHPALPFPRGHAVLLALYCVVMALALVAFIATREPPGAAVAQPLTVGEQLRRAGRLLCQDRVYRRYMVARLSLAMAGIALPFYGIYAKRVLGAPDGMVGVYVTTRVGAQLLFNLPWGRLSDRWGNRLVMRLSSLGNGLAVLLALALVGVVRLLQPQGAWLPYLALFLFFLDGAIWPANALVGSNFLLELVSEAERPLYLGLSNTLVGVVVLLSGLGGLLVDLFGFAVLFSVSLGLCLAGYVLATGLPEPRGNPPPRAGGGGTSSA
jgi:MFS family permease